MYVLELDHTQIKVLSKKAYEWLRKIDNPKRNHRINYFKTIHWIKKFKRYKKHKDKLYLPKKNELALMMTWFEQYPPQSKKEHLLFTYIGLIYKLHLHSLSNIEQ